MMQRRKNLQAIVLVGIVMGLASASWTFEPEILVDSNAEGALPAMAEELGGLIQRQLAPTACLQQPQSPECQKPPLPSAGFRLIQLQINLVAPEAGVVWGFLSTQRIQRKCEEYAQALYHETVSQQPKLANECTEVAVAKRRFDIYQKLPSGSSKFTESYWDGYCHVGVFCLLKDPAGINPDLLCQATHDNYYEAQKRAFAEYNRPNRIGYARVEYEEKCQISLGPQIRAGN